MRNWMLGLGDLVTCMGSRVYTTCKNLQFFYSYIDGTSLRKSGLPAKPFGLQCSRKLYCAVVDNLCYVDCEKTTKPSM